MFRNSSEWGHPDFTDLPKGGGAQNLPNTNYQNNRNSSNKDIEHI